MPFEVKIWTKAGTKDKKSHIAHNLKKRIKLEDVMGNADAREHVILISAIKV